MFIAENMSSIPPLPPKAKLVENRVLKRVKTPLQPLFWLQKRCLVTTTWLDQFSNFARQPYMYMVLSMYFRVSM